MINNLPEDFRFVRYLSIWSYKAAPVHKTDIQVDIFAKGKDDEYSVIGEVKNRKTKFSLKEAEEFFEKASDVKRLENVDRAVFFVFSASGFYKNAIKFLASFISQLTLFRFFKFLVLI